MGVGFIVFVGVGLDCVGGIVFLFVGAGVGEVCWGSLSRINPMFMPMLKAKAKRNTIIKTITGVFMKVSYPFSMGTVFYLARFL
jgi:hypothetical protein